MDGRRLHNYEKISIICRYVFIIRSWTDRSHPIYNLPPEGAIFVELREIDRD